MMIPTESDDRAVELPETPIDPDQTDLSQIEPEQIEIRTEATPIEAAPEAPIETVPEPASEVESTPATEANSEETSPETVAEVLPAEVEATPEDEPNEEAVPEEPATEATSPPSSEAVAESPASAETQEEKAHSPTAKKQRREPKQKSNKNQPTLRQVTARFAGCGRCSFFWAGYRVLYGMSELETAVADSKSGWLELSWNREMLELIYKTYGVRLDITHFHYEGCCKECRRHFVYRASDSEEYADEFRIEITPGNIK